MSPAKGSSSSSIGGLLRGRPSPNRNKTPKRINLPVTAPTEPEKRNVNRLSRGPAIKTSIDNQSSVNDELELAEASASDTIPTVSEEVLDSNQTINTIDDEPAVVAVEEIYEQDVVQEDEAVMMENPFIEAQQPVYVEDDEDTKDHGSWKYVQEDSPLSDSPDIIQSFRPFQSQQTLISCLKVKSSRRSSSKFVLDEDDNAPVCRGRQSIINEDDFHTPEASPSDDIQPENIEVDIPRENLQKDYLMEEIEDHNVVDAELHAALPETKPEQKEVAIDTPTRDDDDSIASSEGMLLDDKPTIDDST